MDGIGAALKQKRLELGKNLEEIAEDTRIRQRYLEAMEAEEWDVLPGKVYLKGFLRTYSRYLGIDENAAMESVRMVLNDVQQADPLPESIELPGRPRRQSTIILAVVAIILLFTAQHVYRNYFYADPVPTPPSVSTPDTNTPAVDQPAQDLPAPTEEKQPEPAVLDSMKLTIKSTRGKCWVQIRTDNKLIYEGTLANSQEISFADLSNFALTLGNAGGVVVSINDKEIGSLGGVGEVVRKAYLIENNEVKEVTT